MAVIQVASSEEALKTNVKNFLEERLRYLLSQHGTISIGVSGGSMPKLFVSVFMSIKDINLNRIRIFMVDERNVAINDPDSNYGTYMRLFPDEYRQCLVPMQIFESPMKSAKQYELNLRKILMPEQHGQTARFDILFLGVGPDGHTASLFPNMDIPKLSEYNWVGAVSNSPKPPPMRITLTMPVLNCAKNVAFIITGKQKAPIVRAMAEGDKNYPAANVRPINNNLHYFLDSEAASEIPDELSSRIGSVSPTEEE